MKLFQYLLLAGLLTVVSCSKGTSDSDDETASMEFSEDEADFIVDAEGDDLILDEEPLLSGTSEGEDIMLEEPIAGSSVELGSDEGSYTVKNGETLMMVAFSVYGDYRKWKDIADLNGLSGGSVASGAVLRYRKAMTPFSWEPQGLPYLIKSGDTLATISNDKYGTAQKWRSIYDNNRPLIKDPNLIFAGFTLYYVAERDLASE